MEDEEENMTIFRDHLSGYILSNAHGKTKVKRTSRGRSRKAQVTAVGDQDALVAQEVEDLAEFIDYIANELYKGLPEELRALNYSVIKSNPDIAVQYSSSSEIDNLLDHIDPSVSESFEAYSLPSLHSILPNLIPGYISAVTAPPPIWSNTRPSECEICERDWVPLTYHHLVPRSVHDKAIKRGWHENFELNKVAWLCRACHSYVHGIASNEELAREWHTVERLKSREDIQRFAGWVGRVRWKKR